VVVTGEFGGHRGFEIGDCLLHRGDDGDQSDHGVGLALFRRVVAAVGRQRATGMDMFDKVWVVTTPLRCSSVTIRRRVILAADAGVGAAPQHLEGGFVGQHRKRCQCVRIELQQHGP